MHGKVFSHFRGNALLVAMRGSTNRVLVGSRSLGAAHCELPVRQVAVKVVFILKGSGVPFAGLSLVIFSRVLQPVHAVNQHL